MKWLKRLLWLVVIVVVVVVAAPFIAVQLVDADYVKREIETRAEAATGRTLRIEGDVKLTAYPWLGAELGRVTLGNASGFDAPHFARIDGASVRVKLMPLLKKEVRMDTVSVTGLDLNLSRKPNGETNWSSLAGAPAGGGSGAGEGRPLAALALGGISIQSGRVNWSDEQAGQDATVSDLSLTTGPLSLAEIESGSPEVDVDARFNLVSSKPQLRAGVELSSRLAYRESPRTIEAKALKLALNSASEAMAAKLKTVLNGDLSFDLDGEKLTLSGLTLGPTEAASGKRSATLTAAAGTITVDLARGAISAGGLDADITRFKLPDGLAGALKLKSDLRASDGFNKIEASKLDASGTAQGGALGKTPMPFAVSGPLRYDAKAGTLAMPGFTARADGFNVNQTTGSIAASGDLALKGDQLSLPKLNVKGKLAGRAVRGGSTNIAMNSAVSANLASGAVSFSGLDLALTELNTMGMAGTVKLKGNSTANGRARTYSVKNMAVAVALAGKQLPQGRLDADATLTAVANLVKQTVTVSRFKASAYDLAANGSVTLSGISGQPSASGAMVVAPFSPRKLMQRLGQRVPVTADPKALGRASIKTKFSATTKRLRLTPVTITIDDSTLRGAFSVRNFAAPAYDFDLKVNGLNVARYLPPDQGRRAATPGAAATAAAGLPADTLRAVNARGSLQIGNLRLANMRITNAQMKLNASNGLIKLTPVSARLYGGTYKGNIAVDARGKVAALSFNEAFNGVDIGRLLTDLQGKAAVTGITQVRAKLTTRGNNKDQLLSALNGNADFRITNGTIRQIDMVRTICNLVEGGADGETRFDAMTGTAKVVNGRIENDQLAVSSPLLRIGARGVVDLPRDALDYRGEVALVGTCKGQGGRVRDKLNGIDIPIRVTGTMSNPKPSLDTSKIVASLAEREIERKSERITKKLQEKVGEEAGKVLGDTAKDLLKGLLGN